MTELVIIKPEPGASQSTLKACMTISSKHSQMECHMKGHFYLRMEELLQPAGTFGIVILSVMAFREHFKNTLNIPEYF